MRKQKQKSLIFETLGWLGTASLLTGFALVSFGMIEAQSLNYQLLNLFGALGLITVAIYKKTYQFVLVNIVWLTVATIALIRLVVL